MKKQIFLAVLLAAAATLSLNGHAVYAASQPQLLGTIAEGVHFSESVLPYDGGLLIANYGDIDNVRADTHKGYILYAKDGVTTTVAAADGRLSKPKAMAVKDHYLFVCDLADLKIYDLHDRLAAPQIVHFPENGDKIVNCCALDGNTLYITMTDPGRIYRLDVSHPDQLDGKTAEAWLSVPGANGIAAHGRELYVVSIPTDFATVQPENVVYHIADVRKPKLERFYNQAGLYDGVKLSEDGRTLYVTDWKSASVLAIDTKTRRATTVYQRDSLSPADIGYDAGTLYLPDLLHNQILELAVR